MSGCANCGRQTPNRLCKDCRVEEYARDVPTGADKAYLDSDGPHRCDICGGVVQTKQRLRTGCPHGNVGGERQ